MTGSKNDALARTYLDTIRSWDGGLLTFMEVCGTHTMAAAKAGLRSLLPDNVRLISGPGCPVCVTPVGYIDHALALASMPNAIITTFGDMMRVPGSSRSSAELKKPPSLQRSKAAGADVRVVYSPLDALKVARENPDKEVIFLSVGFETTNPTIAASVIAAQAEGLKNFSILAANKTVPEALDLLSSADDIALNGFLCPGHVSIITGPEIYEPLASRDGLACAVAGFETVEILRGLASLVEQVRDEAPTVDNCYEIAVRPGGNPTARLLVDRIFEPVDSAWRGIGVIPQSGLAVREEMAAFDAAKRFDVEVGEPVEPKGCRCGDVLKGIIDPIECPLFGNICTPDAPRGACMVSSEGSCAARYHYSSDSEGDW